MVDPVAHNSDIEVPVLIVGAGPAGLTLALTLARYGVPTLTIEKHPSTAHTPRAHIVNQRTVEIFRTLGISKAFHEVSTPQAMMSNNLWVTTLADPEVARSQTWGTAPDRYAEYSLSSPEPMANCPQTVLEPLLLRSARDAGADIRFQTEFIEFHQDADGITSVIRDRPADETRFEHSLQRLVGELRGGGDRGDLRRFLHGPLLGDEPIRGNQLPVRADHLGDPTVPAHGQLRLVEAEAPSAVTRPGTAWCRHPIMRSGSKCPMTWRTETG